jgi:hypothetical protein
MQVVNRETILIAKQRIEERTVSRSACSTATVSIKAKKCRGELMAPTVLRLLSAYCGENSKGHH